MSCNQISNNLIIPNGITKIEPFTFYGCSSLPSVELPDSVPWIGASAFEDCRSMASINLPSNLETIDDDAFMGCSSLTSIKIPKSVTKIGTRAFKTEASGEFEIYFDGTVDELRNKNFEWIVDDDAEQSIIDPDKVQYIHCSDYIYDIPRSGGGSGSGSGSGSGYGS